MLLQAVFPKLLWYLPPKKLLGHLRLNKTHWPDPWSHSWETDSCGSNPKPGSLASRENLGDECNHFMGYFEFHNFFFKSTVYSVFEFSWRYKSILRRTLANIYCLKQDEIRTHLIGTPKEEHFYVFQLFFSLPTIVLRTLLEKDFCQVSDGKPRKAF